MDLIIWYVISLCIIAAMTYISTKKNFSTRTAIAIMLTVSFLSEAVKIFTHMDTVYAESGELIGYYLAPPALPFHLCTVFIFIFLYLFLHPEKQKDSVLMQFTVPTAFVAGFLGISMATSGTDFKDPASYQCFIYHSFVLWFSIFCIIKKETRLSLRSYRNTILIILAIMILEVWINSVLRTYAENGRFVNFFFVAAPPADDLPLLKLDYGYPHYFACLYLTYSLAGLLVHLPFILNQAVRRHHP